MSDLVYSIIKQGGFNKLPPRGIQFMDPDTNEITLFLQLEQESSYNINPYTKPNSYGGLHTLGYKVDFNMYIIHNNFNYYANEMISRIESFKNKLTRVWLLLGNIEPQAVDESSPWTIHPAEQAGNFEFPLSDTGRNKIYNATDKMIIDFGKLFINQKTENVPLRPRLIIQGSGLVLSTMNILLPNETGTENEKRMYK